MRLAAVAGPLTKEERAEIFRRIRDEPFRIDFLHPWQDNSDLGKAIQIKDQFALFSIQVVIRYCKFNWKEQDYMPPEFYREAGGSVSSHFYPEIFIPETQRYVSVDPTYDTALKSAGFPVTEWDGENSSPIAVKSFHVFARRESEMAAHTAWDYRVSHPEDCEAAYGRHAAAINGLVRHLRSPSRSGGLHA